MKALTYCKIQKNADPERLCEVFDCREYIDGLKNRKSRASINESCAALFLLAKTFKNEFHENTSELRYKKDEKGRPYFENRTDIRFSLSHSGEYAVCAVSNEGDIGVDIEKIPTDTKYEKVKERFLSDGEKNRAGDSAEGFATVWTRKEAYYKYKGGQITDLDSEKDKDVTYETFDIDGEYKISVCYERNEKTVIEEPKALKNGNF